MKNHKVRRLALLVFLVILLAVTLSSCYRIREKQYYADESNFITDTAVVESILYNEDTNTIYLWLDEIDAAYESINDYAQATYKNGRYKRESWNWFDSSEFQALIDQTLAEAEKSP